MYLLMDKYADRKKLRAYFQTGKRIFFILETNVQDVDFESNTT